MNQTRIRPVILGSLLMTIGLLVGVPGLTQYLAFLEGYRGLPVGIQIIRFVFFLFAGVILLVTGWIVGTQDQSAS